VAVLSPLAAVLTEVVAEAERAAERMAEKLLLLEARAEALPLPEAEGSREAEPGLLPDMEALALALASEEADMDSDTDPEGLGLWLIAVPVRDTAALEEGKAELNPVSDTEGDLVVLALCREEAVALLVNTDCTELHRPVMAHRALLTWMMKGLVP
jgi:hypothetical protein